MDHLVMGLLLHWDLCCLLRLLLVVYYLVMGLHFTVDPFEIVLAKKSWGYHWPIHVNLLA
jgi:hypothetical protein